MVDFVYREKYDLNDLVKLVKVLRSPDGCPWDREQTHHSIRRGMLEEACEVVEAIDEKNPVHLREELGDVLLQVIFHAGIEEDAGVFDLNDVADAECRKMIFRHPHVFGTDSASSTGDVPVNWEELKRREKAQTSYTDTLDAVSRTLPGLWRAEKLLNQAAKAGFDWKDTSAAAEKLREECGEVLAAVAENSNVEEELGDLLFAAVAVMRKAQLPPERVLQAACDKFLRRFAEMERLAEQQGRGLDTFSPEEQLSLWGETK